MGLDMDQQVELRMEFTSSEIPIMSLDNQNLIVGSQPTFETTAVSDGRDSPMAIRGSRTYRTQSTSDLSILAFEHLHTARFDYNSSGEHVLVRAEDLSCPSSSDLAVRPCPSPHADENTPRLVRRQSAQSMALIRRRRRASMVGNIGAVRERLKQCPPSLSRTTSTEEEALATHLGHTTRSLSSIESFSSNKSFSESLKSLIQHREQQAAAGSPAPLLITQKKQGKAVLLNFAEFDSLDLVLLLFCIFAFLVTSVCITLQ